MSNVFVISDLHIGHRDIHKKWKPQFNSVNEHAEHAIDSWNSVVKKRDVVKVLGDFIIGRENLHYLCQLNGTIHWTLGNHDPKITKDVLRQYPNVAYVDGVRAYKHGVVFSHVPVHPNELVYRSWQFNVHGHIHDPDKNIDDPRYYNANADIMGTTPKLFDEILEELRSAK